MYTLRLGQLFQALGKFHSSSFKDTENVKIKP